MLPVPSWKSDELAAAGPRARIERTIKAGALYILVSSAVTLLFVVFVWLSDAVEIYAILEVGVRALCAMGLLWYRSRIAACGLLLTVLLDLLITGSVRRLFVLPFFLGVIYILMAIQTFRWHRLQRTSSAPAP